MTGFRSFAEVFRYRGIKMVGVVYRPVLGRRRVPAVLFLHGYPGSEKNVDIRRRLMRRGIASFSLHFAGAWGSEGLYSFESLAAQAAAGLRRLRGMDFVDPKRTAVLGFSMGGWTALHLGATDADLKGVVAVAPVGGAEMLDPRTREFIGRASAPLRVRSKAKLYRDFTRAMREQDPAESAARLRAPLLIVHSRSDEVVPFACSSRIFAAARAPKKLIAVSDSPHDFIDRRDWLVRIVSDWLLRQLSRRGKKA